MLKRILFLSAVLFSLLISCQEYETITLLSDNIDALTLAEVFNQEHDDVKISVDYRKNLIRQLEDGVPFDIVAGSNINSRKTSRFFVNLEPEFFLDSIYPELLAEQGDHYLVPLSFNLPVIVFQNDYSPNIESPIIISTREISDLGKDYNKIENGRLTREGFSPLWSNDFLYMSCLAQRIEWNIADTIQYRDSSLENCILYLNTWISEKNNGLEDEFHFIRKYRYIPKYKMLHHNLSRFEMFSLQEYIQTVQEERSTLDFRYVSYNNSLFVTERNFAAVSRESRKKKKLYVLQWMLQEENQKKILDYKQEKRMDQFGFFGGLSSLESVNDLYFPDVYPALKGKIPHNRMLKSEDFYQPYDWARVREQVIIPWIKEKIKTGFSTSLEEFYNEWLFHTISD